MTSGPTDSAKAEHHDEERQRLVARSVYLRFRQKYSGTLSSRPTPRETAGERTVRQGDAHPGVGATQFDRDTEVGAKANKQEFGYLEEIARAIRSNAGASVSSGEEKARGWIPSHGMAKSRTGARSSWWDPKPVGRLIKIEAKQRGWTRPLQISEVTANWKEIVGPHVAQHCPVESFEGGTLIIRADSTAWAQQMQLLLPIVHKRIDEMVGDGVVDKILVHPPKPPSWGRGPRRVPGRGPRDTYG